MQYRVIAGQLVREEVFLANSAEFATFALKPATRVDVAGTVIEHNRLSRFEQSIIEAADFEPAPIVPGGPLCIQIKHVYTGKYPKGGFLRPDRQDMLIASALKDYSVYAPATRAVNFLSRDIRAKSLLSRPRPTEEGTPIVAYYPAVIADSLTLSLEMTFDQFDNSLFQGISKAFETLGGLPLFMSKAGFLLLGSNLVRLAGDAADRLIDGRPKFSQTLDLNFLPQNGPTTIAELRVICNRAFDVSGYDYDWQKGLVSKHDQQPYQGDEPYIVLLIDGAAREGLRDFVPAAISAATLDRFFGARQGSEVAIDGFLSAMRLWNDFNFRTEAERIAQKLSQANLQDAERQALLIRHRALLANILTDELRPATSFD